MVREKACCKISSASSINPLAEAARIDVAGMTVQRQSGCNSGFMKKKAEVKVDGASFKACGHDDLAKAMAGGADCNNIQVNHASR